MNVERCGKKGSEGKSSLAGHTAPHDRPGTVAPGRCSGDLESSAAERMKYSLQHPGTWLYQTRGHVGEALASQGLT